MKPPPLKESMVEHIKDNCNRKEDNISTINSQSNVLLMNYNNVLNSSYSQDFMEMDGTKNQNKKTPLTFTYGKELEEIDNNS